LIQEIFSIPQCGETQVSTFVRIVRSQEKTNHACSIFRPIVKFVIIVFLFTMDIMNPSTKMDAALHDFVKKYATVALILLLLN
jgi:hypothetical protein